MDLFKKRWVPALCATAVMATSLAACGSDNNSSSSSSSSSTADTTATAAKPAAGSDVVAAAQKIVDANKAIDKIGPTQPIGKPIPKNVSFVWVNCGQPACTNQGIALKEAAGVLGWKFKEILAEPTPEKIQAAFDEAIRNKPDAIGSAGFSAALYPRQIAEMQKKKISVLSITGNEESGQNGITFEPLGPKGAIAANRVLANKTIVDIGGKGQVGAIVLGGYPIVKAYAGGYTDEIKTKCPDCTVKELEIQPTSIGKDAPAKIANFMRANPDMKAIYYSYDLLGSGVPAAAKGAGLSTLPKSYGWAPDAPGLAALKTGERSAALLMPYDELAWMLVDAEARIKTGGSAEGSTPTQPVAVIGKDLGNVPDKAEPYPSSVPDYKNQFKKLWGVS